MNLTDISNLRLKNQHIVEKENKKVNNLVQWMGAMQAQDFAMARWAIGIRLPNSTEKQIEESINKGEIIRTHLLRPTWHFVSAEDIYWMMELTAPQIKQLTKSRNNQLGITETVIAKSNKVLGKALENKQDMAREELIKELIKNKIPTDENRASHLFLCAELDKIICSGRIQNNKQTYAFFDKRVSSRITLYREEAISKLAMNYFNSHSPASLQDFIWWSGLSVKDARLGLENIKSDFVSETIDTYVYWIPNSQSVTNNTNNSVHLLPAYDEFLISYKNRTASIPSNIQKKTISDNGIFRPIIVVNGQVTGLWKRTQTKDKVIIEIDLFRKHTKTELNGIYESAELFKQFVDKSIKIKFLTH